MSETSDRELAKPEANLAPSAPQEDELTYLRRMREDYGIAMAALAVVTERLRESTGEPLVIITDAQLADSPDLSARRDPATKRLALATSR